MTTTPLPPRAFIIYENKGPAAEVDRELLQAMRETRSKSHVMSVQERCCLFQTVLDKFRRPHQEEVESLLLNAPPLTQPTATPTIITDTTDNDQQQQLTPRIVSLMPREIQSKAHDLLDSIDDKIRIDPVTLRILPANETNIVDLLKATINGTSSGKGLKGLTTFRKLCLSNRAPPDSFPDVKKRKAKSRKPKTLDYCWLKL
jgi:hypothetical protein